MNSIIPSSLFYDVFLYSYLLISFRLSKYLIYDFFLNFLFKNFNKENIEITTLYNLNDFFFKKYNKDLSSKYYALVINFYFILIYLFSARTYSPFIYFQF